jgi:Flp pilus assembly protein TadG
VKRRLRGGTGHAQLGQTLVIFALVQLVLLSALGLAIDGGYLYMKRRAMQNAADAAALAGAQALGNDLTDREVRQTVLDAAARNGVDPAQVTCTFFTNDFPGGPSQACSDSNTAMSQLVYPYTTVQVRVAERHPTFVMRAVGTTETGTSATATAQVQVPVNLKLGPFVVCAIDTTIATKPPGYNGEGIFMQDGYHEDNGPPKYERLDGDANCWGDPCGKTLDEIIGDNQRPVFNEQAWAYENAKLEKVKPNQAVPSFLIHAPNGVELCNNNSASFKGINYNVVVASYPNDPDGERDYWNQEEFPIDVTTGTKAEVQETVEGVNGCVKNTTKIDDCILILPIVDNYAKGGEGDKVKMALRGVAAFYIQELSNGSHTGALVKDYFIRGESGAFFVPGSHTPKVLRLIK